MSSIKVTQIAPRHSRGTTFIGQNGSTTHFHPHSRVILHEYATKEWILEKLGDLSGVDLSELVTKKYAHETFGEIFLGNQEPLGVKVTDIWFDTTEADQHLKMCSQLDRDQDGNVTKQHWIHVAPRPSVDDDVQKLKEDVITLEGEIEALITLDEKGSWVSTSNDPPASGQVQFSNSDFNTSPMTVKISKLDTDGTGHTFATADVGTWIEFVEDDEDYCLGKITDVDNEDDDFFLTTFDVSVSKGVVHDGNNIKIRLFEAVDDFDATSFVKKIGGDSMQGPLVMQAQPGENGRDTNRVQTLGVYSNSDQSALRLGTTRDRVYIGHTETSFNGPIKVDEIQEKNTGGGVKISNQTIIDTSGESNNTEAGLKLKGNRPSTANSAATITFDNQQSTEKGYLTYRSYGAGTWFAFNQDLDLNNNGLHSVARIRIEPDGGIGSGNNTRLTFHNASTGQEGEGLLVVPRPSSDRRGFVIRGNNADGDEGDMLYTYTNYSGTPDAANYVGKIDSPKNLVNKAYVDSKAQSSANSPVLIHSGSSVGTRTYNYVDPGSISEYQFSSDSYDASGSTLYIFKAWSQKYGWTQVLDYDCTEDTTIEMWQDTTSGSPLLIMRSGIREIVQSQYSQYDAKILLNRFWVKPDYRFSKYNGYTFMIHGMVEKPGRQGTTFDLADDEKRKIKNKKR